MVKIRGAIASSPHVNEIIHLRTQHLGPETLLVGAKLIFDPSLDMAQLAQAIDGVEAAVREVVPHAKPMFIEPDLRRTPSALEP